VITVNSDKLVALSDVKITQTEGALEDAAYTIHNAARSGLVAIEIWWDFYTADGLFFRLGPWEDTWGGAPAILPPGTFQHDTIGAITIRNRSNKPITKVVATVAYVEFADGTISGFPQAAASFEKRREEFRNTYRHLLATYNNDGPDKFVETLSTRRGKETISQRAAKDRLFHIYKSEGLGAALADISRLLSSSTPG